MAAALTDVVDLDRFGRIVAEGLFTLLPGISTTYTEVNPRAQRAFAVIVPEPDPAWWAEAQPVFEAHAHQHPVLQHAERTGSTVATTWDDVADVAGFRRTELYRLFYAPLGIESQLVAVLPAPEGVSIAIAVNRGPEGFSRRDREVMDALRARVVGAYRLAQLNGEYVGLRAALADDGWAVVLVDGDGTVVSASFDGAGPVVAGQPLPEPLCRAVAAAVEPEARLAGPPTRPPGPVRIDGAGPDGEVPFDAVVVPGSVPPHVVLLRPQAPPGPDDLAALGLTRRQAEVALGLVAGEANAEIARRLGIAPATVKKHLEGVYRALGVGSRAAAVARVLARRTPPGG